MLRSEARKVNTFGRGTLLEMLDSVMLRYVEEEKNCERPEAWLAYGRWSLM